MHKKKKKKEGGPHVYGNAERNSKMIMTSKKTLYPVSCLMTRDMFLCLFYAIFLGVLIDILYWF